MTAFSRNEVAGARRRPAAGVSTEGQVSHCTGQLTTPTTSGNENTLSPPTSRRRNM